MNFNEIRKKLEKIQIKDQSPFDKKPSAKQSRDSHVKTKFGSLKIEDFQLFSTLGLFSFIKHSIIPFFTQELVLSAV